MSARYAIRLILERDEAYDEDPNGDPPISVPRYRRALRAALSLEPELWEAPDPDWSPEVRKGYLEGVRDAAETVAEEIGRVLGALPWPRAAKGHPERPERLVDRRGQGEEEQEDTDD